MLNQYAVEMPHVTCRPAFFPRHPIPEGMLNRFLGVPSRREGPPSIWDTHGKSGNVFVNADASSSAPYPQELNQWDSSMARGMGSPRQVDNRRRRTRKGSEPSCVQTPFHWGDELTSCRGNV